MREALALLGLILISWGFYMAVNNLPVDPVLKGVGLMITGAFLVIAGLVTRKRPVLRRKVVERGPFA